MCAVCLSSHIIQDDGSCLMRELSCLSNERECVCESGQIMVETENGSQCHFKASNCNSYEDNPSDCTNDHEAYSKRNYGFSRFLKK